MSLSVDLAPTISAMPTDEEPVKAKPRRKAGRQRFANTCVHREAYKTETGEDWPHDACPKFAHLPGNGRGVKQPGIFRLAKGILVSLVKPAFYFGLIYVAYLLLSAFLGNLSFGNFVPGQDGRVPDGVQQSSSSGLHSDSWSDASIPASSHSRAAHPVVSV